MLFKGSQAILSALCDITDASKQEEAALKRQVQELRIEIDQQKRVHKVAQITQSDYFQELPAVAERLRLEEDDFFGC